MAVPGGGRMGEQPGGLGDGERDHSRVGGRWLVRPDRRGCPGVGAAAQQGGGDGADSQGGHHQHGVPGDRGVEPDLRLIEPEAALTRAEILFYWPAAPGGTDQPGQRHGLAGGYETVVKGQLAGGQAAADEQVVARRGGAQPRRGVPAAALGAGPGRADLPATPDARQRGGGLLAGEPDAAGHGEVEVGRDPQDVGLAAGF